MNTTQRKRLLKLAAFLRTVPKERFDMAEWASGPLNVCGTAGCAIGWATVLFKRVKPRLRLFQYKTHFDSCLVPSCNRKTHLNAAGEFFGINYCDAHYLFSNANDNINATPKFIARKIERFVKANEY